MPDNPKSPRDQFLDELLDASLRQYGRTEPRIGLVNRVLRHIEDAPQKTSWMTGWRLSAVGFVVTIVVVALALISYPPDATHVGPGTLPPANTVPPPDRTPRFNKPIPPSGVRPLELPPCKPGQQPKASAKKSTEEAPESTKSTTKVSEDCVPAPSKQPQTAPAPHR